MSGKSPGRRSTPSAAPWRARDAASRPSTLRSRLSHAGDVVGADRWDSLIAKRDSDPRQPTRQACADRRSSSLPMRDRSRRICPLGGLRREGGVGGLDSELHFLDIGIRGRYCAAAHLGSSPALDQDLEAVADPITGRRPPRTSHCRHDRRKLGDRRRSGDNRHKRSRPEE